MSPVIIQKHGKLTLPDKIKQFTGSLALARDYVYYYLDNQELTEKLKKIRHKLGNCESLSKDDLITSLKVILNG